MTRAILSIPIAAIGLGCSSALPPTQPNVPPSLLKIASPPNSSRPPFRFSQEDDRLLDEIEHGAFNYLWHASGKAGMCPDRSSKAIVSVAGVGFELSGIPVGVERHWITREDGEARARLILTSLLNNPDNRKAGLFYHFLDADTAGQPTGGYEHAVSTVDSALLFAGVLTASSYFGGEVQRLGDRLFADADWRFFIAGDQGDGGKGTPITKGTKPKDFERGFIALSWRPTSIEHPSGEGCLSPYYWIDAGDEHRLVTFLAVCAPDPDRRADAALYYRLRRQTGEYKDTGPFVYVPFSGALFTAFFAHCWINYAAMGPDDPAAFNDDHHPGAKPGVDWWENSRRTVRLHQIKCAENPLHLPGLGENAWGLSACDAPSGYIVPGVYPDRMSVPGERDGFDYTTFKSHDDYADGTLAPYAAGCSILFDPTRALASLRHYRSLDLPIWHDPASGGYAFQDSVNLGKSWVAPDCVAIDQGPLLLCLENARTGLIWRLFHSHPAIQSGMQRLHLTITR